MNAKNCRKCGKFFMSHTERNTCGTCFEESQESFMAVKEYLYDNPGSNAIDVINGLKEKGIEISNSEILEFVNDNRLIASGINSEPVEKKVEGYKQSRGMPSFKPSSTGSGFHIARR